MQISTKFVLLPLLFFLLLHFFLFRLTCFAASQPSMHTSPCAGFVSTRTLPFLNTPLLLCIVSLLAAHLLQHQLCNLLYTGQTVRNYVYNNLVAVLLFAKCSHH